MIINNVLDELKNTILNNFGKEHKGWLQNSQLLTRLFETGGSSRETFLYTRAQAKDSDDALL